MKDIYPDKLQQYKDNGILVGYRGSIAHGTYISNTNPDSISDKDVMAIIVPSQDYYLGLKQFGSRGTKEYKEGIWDIVVYDIKKYIHLLRKSNPNVLSLLWLENNYYIQRLPEGNKLVQNRDLFVSKKIYKAFTGYAYGQLKRMERFNFEGYMGEKRKKIVKRYGFDVKNAATLIRLLRMGIEFLNEGRLFVYRDDAEELLAIKRGEWSLEKVKDEADRLFRLAEESYVKSDLPTEPDFEKINNLCVDLIQSYYRRRK